MKYSDGVEVRLEDRVKLWDGCVGVVVCSLDTNEYSSAYPEKEWGYLKSGVIVKTEKGGVIHYIETDEEWELISRKK